MNKDNRLNICHSLTSNNATCIQRRPRPSLLYNSDKKLSKCWDSATRKPSDAEIIAAKLQNSTFSIRLHWRTSCWSHKTDGVHVVVTDWISASSRRATPDGVKDTSVTWRIAVICWSWRTISVSNVLPRGHLLYSRVFTLSSCRAAGL